MDKELIYNILSFTYVVLFLVSAFALMEAFDYTIKYGFVTHDKYVIPSIFLTITTIIIYFLKRNLENKLGLDEDTSE